VRATRLVVAAALAAVTAATPLVAAPPAAAAVVQGTTPSPRFVDVASAMKRAADYYRGSYAVTTGVRNGWSWSTYTDGLHQLFRTTGDQRYLDDLMAWGRDNAWAITTREQEADEIKAAQTYFDLNALDATASLTGADTRLRTDLTLPDESYWWIDALFMTMPSWVRWSGRANDTAYLDTMDRLYRWTRDDGISPMFPACAGQPAGLYDEAERLWYRDCRFIASRSGGQKVFWGRGNAWVMAGMVETLRQFQARPGGITAARAQPYVTMLRDMADRVRGLQGTDGLWRTSLLNPAGFPVGETSATALFTYAMAEGISLGVLDRDTYAPVVLRAWDALTTISLQPSGFVSRCQFVGDQPGTPYTAAAPATPATPASPGTLHQNSPPFCVGSFLLAGSGVAKLTASLSRGRPVTATAQQTGNEAPRLVDGDVVARWSASGFPQSATIDLGGERRVSNSLLVTLADRPYQYRIETSLDGTAWTTVVDRTANTATGSQLDAFGGTGGTVSARYVRLTVTGVAGGGTSWVSIREFSVHDRYAPRADLARGAPTTATSSQAAKPPSRATDGVTSTHWASAALPTAAAPQDLVVDLGASRPVDTVRVFSQPAWGPRAVQVWVSPDNAAWTQVAAAALPDALGPHTLLFPVTPARYVRLRSTGAYGQTVHVPDFEVYGG
jgi:rhamnogalacturonyl hydrolase YesR